MASRLQLADYARSSAAWRVRIALAWKGLDWDTEPVDLRRGEQRDPEHLARNAQGLVPTLRDGEFVLSQSLAILEYLEETRPEPPLLPSQPADRARVRQLALLVACDVHPIQNLRVRQYLRDEYGASEERQALWCRHWIREGLDAYEALVCGGRGAFSHGDAPSLADVCLVPQLRNARNYGNDLDGWPTLTRIESTCLELDAFRTTASVG